MRWWVGLIAALALGCGREVVEPPIAIVCDGGLCGDPASSGGDQTAGDPAVECGSPADCTTPPECYGLPSDCVNYACVYPVDDAAKCDDSNACTDDACVDGTCQSDPINCGDPPAPSCVGEVYHYWTSPGCDPASGECFVENTLDCSPDCQVNCLEACEALVCAPQNGGCRTGACEPGTLPAECAYSNVNDGTACDRASLGTLDGYCVSGSCVECTEDQHCPICHSCQSNACTPVGADTTCDDGLWCNGADRCNASGACNVHSGDPCAANLGDADDDCSESCNENNDTCTANDPPGSTCDDGTYCNGTDTCDYSGACDFHSGDPCAGNLDDDDDDCSESCDEGTDTCIANDPPGSDCNDGVNCNGADTCNAAGACSVHSGDPCTGRVGDGDGDCSERCNESTGTCIANDPQGSPCDDGDLCNGDDTCDAGSCTVHAGDPCASQVGDGDADCTEACNPSNGACTAADPNDSSCNLTDPCITGESCSSGVCTGVGCSVGTLCAPGVGCRDPDLNQSACNTVHTWLGNWDTSFSGTANCCGDDAGENVQQALRYWGGWSSPQMLDVWACCASSEDCVRDPPECRPEGDHAGVTQLCVNGAYYHCNEDVVCREHFSDVQDERCLRTGVSTYGWGDISVVNRDGANPREGLSWLDVDYDDWGNVAFRQTNNEFACCQAASDCVTNSGVCRPQGFKIDGITDWICDAGDWYECGWNGQGQSRQGQTCEWNAGLGEWKWQ